MKLPTSSKPQQGQQDSVRCRNCVGCHTQESAGPCGICEECRASRECAEHSRLCFSWRQPTTTFVEGSVVTSIASIQDIIEYDLSEYKRLLERLEDASLEIEAVLDEFPARSEKHCNDRYNIDRRDRDARNEEEQWLTIEALLRRQQEHIVRLQDVWSDEEDGLDDAVDVAREPARPYGLMSHTNTLYPIGAESVPGTPIVPAPEVNTGGQDDQDWLGLGFGEEEQEAFARILEPARTPPPLPQVAEVGVSPPSKANPGQDSEETPRDDYPENHDEYHYNYKHN